MAFRVSSDVRDGMSDSNVSSYNTIKRQPRNSLKYSTRLTLAFALTAVMTAVVLSIVLAFVWERQFQSYTRVNMQRMVDQAAMRLSQLYSEENAWTKDTLDYVEASSESMSEVGIRLADGDGNLLYDDSGESTDKNVRGGRYPRKYIYPKDENSVVTAQVCTEEVSEDGEVTTVVVGTVTFWSVNSEALLTKSDSLFRTNSYGAIVTAASFAVIIACVIGVFMARALTKPLRRITTTAARIRNGDLTARSGIAGSDEIGRLGETTDDMASTLERDIKLERRLTSDVAHELRTPLMAIQATVEAMRDGVLPTNQDNLARISMEVRRLARLVDAMLRLSRMENGTIPMQIIGVDVIDLTSELVEAQAQLFQDNNIDLTFKNETGQSRLVAEIDPDLIREAIVNLLSNAMRYTPEGGSVTVRVARDRHNVSISVQDTGVGIAKEDIPRVFSRFWRSDASRERAAGGLGVGLSLTKEIVDRHNGTVSVDSEEGVGTTFTLNLPLSQKK